MTTLYISEFADFGRSTTETGQVAAQPPTNEQTVSLSGTSAASSAFKNNTRLVRLHTDSICSIEFGTAPTATTSTARMAANQTEYFTIPAGQSYKVAAITNT